MDIVVFGAPNLQDIVFDDKTSYAFFCSLVARGFIKYNYDVLFLPLNNIYLTSLKISKNDE